MPLPKKIDNQESMYFPKEIKALRQQLGETQEQFAEHFEVSHAAVSDWESGKSEAPYKVLEWAIFRSVKTVVGTEKNKKIERLHDIEYVTKEGNIIVRENLTGVEQRVIDINNKINEIIDRLNEEDTNETEK